MQALCKTDVNSLRCVELKSRLKTLGLSVSGNRNILVRRLNRTCVASQKPYVPKQVFTAYKLRSPKVAPILKHKLRVEKTHKTSFESNMTKQQASRALVSMVFLLLYVMCITAYVHSISHEYIAYNEINLCLKVNIRNLLLHIIHRAIKFKNLIQHLLMNNVFIDIYRNRTEFLNKNICHIGNIDNMTDITDVINVYNNIQLIKY